MSTVRLLFAIAFVQAITSCAALEADENSNTPPPNECPAQPIELMARCDLPSCETGSGELTYATATISAELNPKWTVVTWAASEISDADENTTLRYDSASSTGLTASNRVRRHRPNSILHPQVHTPSRIEQLTFQRNLRARSIVLENFRRPVVGTAIQGKTRSIYPKSGPFQSTTCTLDNPQACGTSMLCVVEEGETSGTCESKLAIKYKGTQSSSGEFTATVRAVGNLAAVVVDEADDSQVSDEDVSALIRRFDEHIGPRLHQFFGKPEQDGKDRDGNGVVILLLTSKVSAEGQSVVGFFEPRDLEPSSSNPDSNTADILYLQPPSDTISLDNLSGTIAHEYQHLINFYAKVILAESEQEEVWLDEGLSTFAEDLVGYGDDAFRNVLAYLLNVSDTSLTGYGLIHSSSAEADSFERRGAAYLLVRYWFERAGKTEFPDGPGAVPETDGIAAIRNLVQSEDTGIDAFTASGVTWNAILSDFFGRIALDGTEADCRSNFGFNEPETDAYTGFQRGLSLRQTIQLSTNESLELTGPQLTPLESKEVPFPINGAEFHKVSVPGGTVQLKISGPSAVPANMRILAGF